jgi:glycosyltransferase involved in cell wall biosynthesis
MARIVIVIPTYNRARTVGRAIDSALAQGRGDLACLVVDDGSTDGTRDMLARYAGDGRVTIIASARNRGVTGAKNLGLDALPGDCAYFGILDSDDVLVPGAIDALERAHETGHCSQVFGWCEDPATAERTGKVNSSSRLITYEQAISGAMEGEFWQLARRDVLGGLRFEPRAAGGEASLWWRLMKQAPALLIGDVVRLYDRSGEDRVSRLCFEPGAAARKMFAYRALIDAVGPDLRRVSPPRYAHYRFEEAKWAALAGLRGQSLRALASGFLARPSLSGARAAVVSCLPGRLMRRVYERRYVDQLRR